MLKKLIDVLKGGQGSGNFGHEGIHGHQGGSGGGGAGNKKESWDLGSPDRFGVTNKFDGKTLHVSRQMLEDNSEEGAGPYTSKTRVLSELDRAKLSAISRGGKTIGIKGMKGKFKVQMYGSQIVFDYI